MAIGWNLWLWLQCIGVVSGCCIKRYTFPHNITYPYSTCITSFLQLHPYFFVHLKNVFSFLLMLFLCNIANVAQRTFEIVQKSRSRRHGDIYNYIYKNVDYESQDFHVQGTDNGDVEVSLLHV